MAFTSCFSCEAVSCRASLALGITKQHRAQWGILPLGEGGKQRVEIHRSRYGNQLSGLTPSPKEQRGSHQPEGRLPSNKLTGSHEACAQLTTAGAQWQSAGSPVALDPRNRNSYTTAARASCLIWMGVSLENSSRSTPLRVQLVHNGAKPQCLLAWPGCHTAPHICHGSKGLSLFPHSCAP